MNPLILPQPMLSQSPVLAHGSQPHRRQNNGMNARGKVVKYGLFSHTVTSEPYLLA
jgi:hypothetical protein